MQSRITGLLFRTNDKEKEGTTQHAAQQNNSWRRRCFRVERENVQQLSGKGDANFSSSRASCYSLLLLSL